MAAFRVDVCLQHDGDLGSLGGRAAGRALARPSMVVDAACASSNAAHADSASADSVYLIVAPRPPAHTPRGTARTPPFSPESAPAD